VTVLIGRSGVGKSNFLRAIRFLRNYLLSGDTAVQTEGGWERIYPFGLKANLSFSVRFSIPGYDAKFQYEVAWGPHPHQPGHPHIFPARERLRLGEATIF